VPAGVTQGPGSDFQESIQVSTEVR